MNNMAEDFNIADYIDHTLLKPEATREDIHMLCEQAMKFNFHSVCVNSIWVRECHDYLAESDVAIAAVVGFPFGASVSEVKAFEAAISVSQGASEIDMVLPIGLVKEGQYGEVTVDIEKVVQAVDGQAIVKVILETGYLNDEQIAKACRCAEQAGAFFVKTSTGYGPHGATEAHIRLMKKSVSEHILIKASGGIRDLATAEQMIKAGASRIGTSSGIDIMKEALQLGEGQ